MEPMMIGPRSFHCRYLTTKSKWRGVGAQLLLDTPDLCERAAGRTGRAPPSGAGAGLDGQVVSGDQWLQLAPTNGFSLLGTQQESPFLSSSQYFVRLLFKPACWHHGYL